MDKVNKKNIKLILLALKSKSLGYTLIESLVAVVVVGILIASVAPLLALTTASRVQARRIDLATQALRAYVDGVRGGAVPPPQAPGFVITNPLVNFNAANNYGFAPNIPLANYLDAGTRVDTNGNGFDVNDPLDFVIQAVRPSACPSPAPTPNPTPCLPGSAQELTLANDRGYLLAIKIFRADSFANSLTPNGTEQAIVFIGSNGSPNTPLISTITQVFPNSGDGNLSDINAGITF